MGNWIAERRLTRRLKQTGSRLKSLRDELHVIDEQLAHLSDEAEDLNVRSLVSESSSAAAESRRAREHADAMAKHRAHVIESIHELERRQDDLLDRMVG